MNMLKNKKGFTLIEMLVVIAIIAVLVAIIIPTVSSATTKASAAANAANLRSYKAELTTAYLAGDIKPNASNNGVEKVRADAVIPDAPVAKAMTGVDATEAEVTFNPDTKEFKVTFSTFDIDDFAHVAEIGGDVKSYTPGTSEPSDPT